MKIFADLHLHSHYSRATSKNMNIENIDKYAKIKGLNLMGTGDFTHPVWLKELKKKLKEVESGIYQYKSKDIFYMLSTEISLIYSQDNRVRKIHHVVLAPNFEVVGQINSVLGKRGNLSADGRPIIGSFPSPDFAEVMMKISKDIMIIPAHAWTPWFSIFGSKSGFDSVEECFQDQSKHIYALETGMSSDPAMNWRISALDKYSLVSFSDSHSYYTWRLGREACVFELSKLNYKNIVEAIKEKDSKKFLYTIETNPAYGKYHWDGHRACNIFMSPKDSKKYKDYCPVCKKKITIGVEHRVEELADRKEGYKPKGAIPFKILLPLGELIATVFNTEVFTKKVFVESEKLIKEFGSELNVLLEAEKNKLKLLTNPRIVDAIMKNREGKIKVQPGYDGVYGKPILNGKIKKCGQKRIDQFT